MTQISGTLITRNYASFRGIDFSNRKDEISIYRSPDAKNMWKNYKNSAGRCIETRPDIKLLEEYSNTIFGLFFYDYRNKTHRIVHSGKNLYDNKNLIYTDMNEYESKYFVYKNILYIKDGKNYLCYDGVKCKNVIGFIPTTHISMSPSGGGTRYQDVNLLNPLTKNSFVGDGEAKEYKLDAQNLDENSEIKVWINDEEVEKDWTINYSDGKVIFNTAPPEPNTVGQDNVIIQFSKTISGYADRIKKCTLLEVFDNRVFFSGNPDYPNVLWHSSLDDPTYCSDTDYYEEGVDDADIRSIVAGNNALWVLKEPSQTNTTIFYHNPTIDSDYGKIYPSVHSSISTGCVAKGINFNDTICFFSERGLEAITGDVTTEQTLTHMSTLIDSKLLNENNYTNLIMEEWQGYLLVIINNKMYLADSRNYATVENHNEFEWFYFEFNPEIKSTYVRDEVLYLCVEETEKGKTKHRIYTLNDFSVQREIESYWTTIQDEYNYPQYQKITNKKGCAVDMEGKEIEIYAQADNKGFDFIKKYENAKGYVVPRIKKKKWKWIQLKFQSKYAFNLYSATLESYIGSYVKR